MRIRTLLLEGVLIMAAIVLGKILDSPIGYCMAAILGLAFLIAWYLGKEEGEDEFEQQGFLGGDFSAASSKTDEPPSLPVSLPKYCPRVAPHSYGQPPGQNSAGLIVTNPGYPAFNVHIPTATIGSLYRIVFPSRVPQLLE